MMLIGDVEELRQYLAGVQERRESRVDMTFTPALSSRLTAALINEALVTGMPMAQGMKRRIARSRGQGVTVTAKVHYREGVRMAEYALENQGQLSDMEAAALCRAKEIAAPAMCLPDEQARCEVLYGWVCRNIRYVNTAPGQKGYDRLVGAAGALTDGWANCQGFADTLYLLCRLCGMEVQYRCGRGEKLLHVWNAVRIGGVWREVDASRGARSGNSEFRVFLADPPIDNLQTNFATAKKTPTQVEKNVLY